MHLNKSTYEFLQVKGMSEEKPYLYARFVWWRAHNLEKLAMKLKERFTLVGTTIFGRKEESELALLKGAREEIAVKADTLSVRLSAYRAVLSQKEKAPFTQKDMELRETILNLYPRDRPTPLPWSFSSEPSFEVQEH